jgi:two-component system chemotaxis response regulator CheB
MAPIRILVVDDSVVIRRLLTTTLGEAPGLEVVATASHGKIALAKIPQYNPDIVILDVEMPEMDGIETLRRIRREAPRLPVIMFSTRTERGAMATIEALTSGASDYVTKPSNVGNVLLAMARVREEMVPKILALTGRRPAEPRRPAAPTPPASPRSAPIPSGTGPIATAAVVAQHLARTVQVPVVPIAPAPATAPTQPMPYPVHVGPGGPAVRPAGTTGNPIVTEAALRSHRVGPRLPVDLVAIGASTGGPNALSVLLGQLPAEFPVPVVIVQHMLASFTRHFAERLARQCPIKIVEASAGDVLAPGCVYIARGGYHLLVERRAGRACLALNQDELENFCRPAVDVLFRSVAHSHGPHALAVVLTGMGHDGLLGSRAIRDAGGDVIVQDEASSVVWGMPGFVARAGLASDIVALDQLAGEIRRRVAGGAPRALEAMP